MSGRDLEPVTAFFPSIDRNLMRELDRHLRSAQPEVEQPLPPVPVPPRPDIDGVLDAVEQAAMSIAMMTARIHELESHIYGLETANDQLISQLEATTRRAETIEADLQTTSERMKRAELLAAHQLARGNTLEQQLAAALADLTRVTDAIASRLGMVAAEEGA